MWTCATTSEKIKSPQGGGRGCLHVSSEIERPHTTKMFANRKEGRQNNIVIRFYIPSSFSRERFKPKQTRYEHASVFQPDEVSISVIVKHVAISIISKTFICILL